MLRLIVKGKRKDTEERLTGFGFKLENNEYIILTDKGEFPIIPSSLMVINLEEAKEDNRLNIPQKNITGLHDAVMATCIGYLKNKNMYGVEEISFNADSIGNSVDAGCWMPDCDSSLYIYGYIDGRRKLIGNSI